MLVHNMSEQFSASERVSRRTQVRSVMELNPRGDPSQVTSPLDH